MDSVLEKIWAASACQRPDLGVDFASNTIFSFYRNFEIEFIGILKWTTLHFDRFTFHKTNRWTT